jgi:excisionase family DNA binding protein
MEVLMTKNIRVKEAAAYIGISKSSLDKLRCFGGGPRFYKLGRSVVYNTADLDEWVAERARTSTWCANDNAPARNFAA